jgi:hypothetical protein
MKSNKTIFNSKSAALFSCLALVLSLAPQAPAWERADRTTGVTFTPVSLSPGGAALSASSSTAGAQSMSGMTSQAQTQTAAFSGAGLLSDPRQ